MGHNLVDLMDNPVTPPKQASGSNFGGGFSSHPAGAVGLGDPSMDGWGVDDKLTGLFDGGTPKGQVISEKGGWDDDLIDALPQVRSPRESSQRTTSSGSAVKIAGGVKIRGKKAALGPVTRMKSDADWGDLLN